MISLPTQLGELLEIAVKDAKAFEAAGGVLDMGTWYDRYRHGEPCHACMAGAVMAMTLKVDIPDEGRFGRGPTQAVGQASKLGLLTQCELANLQTLIVISGVCFQKKLTSIMKQDVWCVKLISLTVG